MRIVPSLAIVAAVGLLLAGCQGKTSAAPNPTQDRGSGVAADSGKVQNSAPARDDASEEDAAAGDEQRAQAELAKKNDERPVLVCFGDSLTAGLGTGAGQSY